MRFRSSQKPHLRYEDGRQELAATRMPGAALVLVLLAARKQAVDSQARQNAGPEQQNRVGFHGLERSGRCPLDAERGRGLVHDLLHPRKVLLARMNREIIALVVLMPVQINAVPGKSAGDKALDGLIGGFSGREGSMGDCSARH
jgi:hypothetical protein